MRGTNESSPDRWRLGFKEAVLSSFGFLRSYGLRPVEEDPTFVRYESEAVFVNVYHGRASFEIGVEIGRKDRPEKYGLDYLVSWAGKQAWAAEGFGRSTMFQVSSREGVQRFVPKVAELVKKYGEPFLAGSTAFYEELVKANERASIAYQREQILMRIRKEADAAWGAKDFCRVFELYEPIRESLTEIETKRLSYAQKHVRSCAEHGCPKPAGNE